MLKMLHIENIAVIEKAEVDFSAGLNVLTGETGAGKSIVIDALGAVLGGTLGKEVILDLISSCGFDTRIRGERLSLEDFALLSRTAKQRLDALKDR